MHEVLVNRLEGLSLPSKSVDRLNDRPDVTLDVYRGRKTSNNSKKSERQNVLPNEQIDTFKIRPRGYKTFFMFNSIEHEIFPAHKC